MTTPLRCPFGRRDSIFLTMILSALALSACMTSQEKKQREENVEQIKADARARLEQQEQEQEEETQEAQKRRQAESLKAWLDKWVSDNDPYIRELCASEPGTEHQWTWENFKVAVSTDPLHTAEAEKAERPIIDCEELRHRPPPKFNAAEFMAQTKAERDQRDEWLASRAGKSYQRRLCSLTGDAGKKALEQALQIHGIVPRANITDELKARETGFAILDCEKLIATLKAEEAERDQWLASPAGKEYQKHLCSLAGPARHEALAAALNLHGIVSRESVIDESKTRSEGFAILDCKKQRTSALGYTWSNAFADPSHVTNI